MLHRWSALSKLQLGNIAEQLFRAQFAMAGFDVFVPEVDEKGIDFLARAGDGRVLEVQVKSVRGDGYIFLRKEVSPLAEDRFVAIARFVDGEAPQLFVVPSMRWRAPDDVFVSRDYAGKKSKPEWGITISEKTVGRLQEYAVEVVMDALARGQNPLARGNPQAEAASEGGSGGALG